MFYKIVKYNLTPLVLIIVLRQNMVNISYLSSHYNFFHLHIFLLNISRLYFQVHTITFEVHVKTHKNKNRKLFYYINILFYIYAKVHFMQSN